jgi:hypothetical protein
MAIVSLQGRDYLKDNSLVRQLLRPLVLETAAWNYVKQFNVTQDGRSAFLALQTRGEGEAAVDVQRAAAEEIIQTARYTGKSKRFSIGNYINLLQGAFTEPESIGKGGEYALTKKQKVSIFTKGLVAEEYAATKHSIYQNEKSWSGFQNCYAFVETMEQFKPSYANTSSFDCNVLDAGSKKGIDKGYRSPAQRAALSKEEKDKILSARCSKKSSDRKGKKGKKPENNKRKLKSVVTEAAEAISAITDDTDMTGTDGNRSRMLNGSNTRTSPADQFGHKAHKIKKIIQSVVVAAKGGKKSE